MSGSDEIPPPPEIPIRADSAWQGSLDYTAFVQSVQTHSRFVRSKHDGAFLERVLQSCEMRGASIKEGSLYWRARLGCMPGDNEVPLRRSEPYPPDSMKPIPNWQSEGRANPRGIPYLYMANTRDTALSEVRPWIGASISVSQLRIVRDLKVIDCSKQTK